jgi:hypothetical protein
VSKLTPDGSAFVYSTLSAAVISIPATASPLTRAATLTSQAGRFHPTSLRATLRPAHRSESTAPDLDAFLVKLNASGTGLLYSTFLGGSDFEIGLASP